MIPNFLREQIALGRRFGAEKVQLLGKNDAISNTAETVWLPGATFAPLFTAAAMEAVSGSASDAAAGTGARTIYVEGVDANYKLLSEIVTLNGVTPVALTGVYLRVNRVRVLTVGSGGTNAGTIDVRKASGAVVQKEIKVVSGIGLGQEACFHYTVPAQKIALLGDIEFSATGATDGFSVYLDTIDSNQVRKTEGEGKVDISSTSLNEGKGVIRFGDGLLIPEKTCLELRAVTDGGAGALVAMAQLIVFEPKEFAFV